MGRSSAIFKLVQYFFSRRQPEVSRILLVESGSRFLLEGLIPVLRRSYGEKVSVDVVTCYAGAPEGFRPDAGKLYHVGEYRGGSGFVRIGRELAANQYSVLAMICSDEPVMTKWKWALALRIPAKVLVLNENGDYFWLDYSNWRIIRHFVLYRAGLAGEGAVRTLARVFLFPFTFLYLILYATTVHLGRALRRS
jgi:hypothetical protein